MFKCDRKANIEHSVWYISIFMLTRSLRPANRCGDRAGKGQVRASVNSPSPRPVPSPRSPRRRRSREGAGKGLGELSEPSAGLPIQFFIHLVFFLLHLWIAYIILVWRISYHLTIKTLTNFYIYITFFNNF